MYWSRASTMHMPSPRISVFVWAIVLAAVCHFRLLRVFLHATVLTSSDTAFNSYFIAILAIYRGDS